MKTVTPKHRVVERRHAAPVESLRERLAKLALGKGEHHSRHAQSRRLAAPAVRAEVRRPQALPGELNYTNAAAEHLKGKERHITATAYKPILSAEQVHEQLGVDLGALQAVIHLPKTEQPLYCFNQTHSTPKDVTPQFMFATPEQLIQIGSMKRTGVPEWDDIFPGILIIDNATYEGKHRNRQTIGKQRWLPVVGNNAAASLQEDSEMAWRYRDVSDRQVTVELNVFNDLIIIDQDSDEGTWVEYGTEPNAAVDPWGYQPLGPDWRESFVTHD